MSYRYSHIKSALKFIAAAKPAKPLTLQLKSFFAADKRFGSKDRKEIAAMVYTYYRLGKALPGNAEARLDAALTAIAIDPSEIFPFHSLLSPAIEAEKFVRSFSQQPDTFIRIRPGKQQKVAEHLTAESIPFQEKSLSCFAMPPAVKLDKFLHPGKDYVIQDASSQQVLNYLLREDVFLPKNAAVWDCCAASGGKSILVYDLLHGHVNIKATDIRPNILENLQKRFHEAGIVNYNSAVIDLQQGPLTATEAFDVIICDAPCTGSGTWARTPEQLFFFVERSVAQYAQKQKLIAENAAKNLKPGGYFFYITCSVFRAENESIVAGLTGLTLLQQTYIKGYEHKADSMFVAVLQK